MNGRHSTPNPYLGTSAGGVGWLRKQDGYGVPPKTPKSAKAACDRLFSEKIRSLGWCEWCGTSGVRLETSHWLSRRYAWTRTYEDNAFCFCSACHRKWHNDPTAATRFAINQRGEATYQRIRERANRRDKFDWFAEWERLSGP